MIMSLVHKLRRFGRDENGAVILFEFVIFVPLLFSCFLMSVEMGIYSMRNMFLDRGLDIAVRHIRLNTDLPMTHNDIKDMVCDYAGFVDDCDTTLRLEMTPVDPRNFAAFNQAADCVDTSQPVTPARGFVRGQEHDMMLLRACVKFRPVFPGTGLGFGFAKDGSGMAQMISAAAFVQEPR